MVEFQEQVRAVLVQLEAAAVRYHRVAVGAPPCNYDPTKGSILFVGNATTLITAGGFTLLTDPNFLHVGHHAHLGYGLTFKRKKEYGLDLEDLPPIDACLLSHLHGDHWDRVAEACLPKTLPIVTNEHAAKILVERGFERAIGMRDWDEAHLERNGRWLTITALPGRHGPRLINAFLPPVIGTMLQWGAGTGTGATFRLYISGDTLVGNHLKDIPRRYPKVDLALLHLGGARIFGVLLTMDAAQAVEAIRLINAQVNIPIHYNDYPVFKSTLEELVVAVRPAGVEGRVRYLGHGQRYHFSV